MSNQVTEKQVSKFNQKSPEEKLKAMVRYREHRKQKVKPEFEGIEHPEDYFIKSVIKDNLIGPYLKDPNFDIPVHSERQNKDLTAKS